MKRLILLICLICIFNYDSTSSQSTGINLRNPTIQADYVIITPLRYVSIMQRLAAFRMSKNGFTVAIVTIESIYSTFGQGVLPDNAIKNFISFTLTGGWSTPAPQFYLLAGNVDAVPSHKEPGLILPPDIYEDSVLVDQWFVEDAQGMPSSFMPVAAIGRFPARDSITLAIMVSKTIQYDTTTSSPWFSSTLIVADYISEIETVYEDHVEYFQSILAPVWTGTRIAHVRQSSPLYKTRQQFRLNWDQGAAIVGFIGRCNWMQFSQSGYFTTWDVDSLARNSSLAFCILETDQRFERTDTPSIAVGLLQVDSKGAVATLAPSGLVYDNPTSHFFELIFRGMSNDPKKPIGKVVLDAKRNDFPSSDISRQTLLGDPALVIKSPLLTGIIKFQQQVPAGFQLYQNYPNPFNSTTTITLSLPRSSVVTLKVFDLLGREVETIYNGKLEAGISSMQWNPKNASSGIYFCRLIADRNVKVNQMLLLK